MPGSKRENRLLVLMAKQPRANHTKTRLSPPLSPEESADLYRCFLQDKLAQMREVGGATPAIAYAPADARDYFEALAPGFELIQQRGENLAARLRNVFDETFVAGWERVAAIDGDTPTLPPGYLAESLAALDDPAVDVTLGPCEDGGYYVIGMKHPHPTLFDITMSTAQVTRDTLDRAAEAALAVHLLPEWYDVDRPEDLCRLAQHLNGGHGTGLLFAAPATAAFLARHRLA
jgi:rSAM/selenodomain-associated transferase 1